MDKQVKRIGFLISAFGLIAFWGNFVKFPYEDDMFNLYYRIFILVCVCLVFMSSFFKAGKYVQVVTLTLGSLVALFISPLGGFANSLLILVVILMYKYGMLKKNPIAKFSIYVLVMVLTQFAGYMRIRSEEATILVKITCTIQDISYFAFFLALLIIIFYNEIKKYVQNEKDLKSEKDNLNDTVVQTQGYIKKIEAKYIDPEKVGLTEKELALLKALCIYRESNTELGKRLGKSPNTVKVQLSKIMNKISVETRHDLINHCRYYFIKNSEEETVKV